MNGRGRPRALVVVRDGPATERGWLALRTALALGLGGYDVSVWLEGAAASLAAAGLDSRAWLSGDPRDELAGLREELGAAVHSEAGGDGRTLGRLYAEAALVVAP